jgi:RNA recognition motif-containing protein
VISQEILNKVKGLRTYASMTGAVFDIEEQDLKEVELQILSYKAPNSSFTISKADSLPELTQSDQRLYGNSSGFSNEMKKRRDIFLGNLPYHCVENDVEKHLESNGIGLDKVEIRMVFDKETSKHKGFCFVSVYDEEKFNKILNMRNKTLGGKVLRVDDALNKKSR